MRENARARPTDGTPHRFQVGFPAGIAGHFLAHFGSFWATRPSEVADPRRACRNDGFGGFEGSSLESSASFKAFGHQEGGDPEPTLAA